MQNMSKQQLNVTADPFLVDASSKDTRDAHHGMTPISGLPEGYPHAHVPAHYDSPAPPPGLSYPSNYSHQLSQASYRVSMTANIKEGGSPYNSASFAPASGGSPKKPATVATHQSRNSLSKAPHLPFLNLSSLKNYSAFGSPVKPPTPLAVPPTPLSHPSAQAHPTPTQAGSQGASGKFLGALKLIRSDAGKHSQASEIAPSRGGQPGTLHPFALPPNEPQQYICYNLDAKTSPGVEASPLSPPPTPVPQTSPQHVPQASPGRSTMAICTPPHKPVPAPAPLPPKADKAGSIPTCSKFLAEGRLNPAFEQQYEILDELGSGGFGFVIRARRRLDGLIVAVKFIFRDRVSFYHGD